MKFIIFYDLKGGVCKSTLCHYTSKHLESEGKKVQVQTTDRQKHVLETGMIKDADHKLFDCIGAHTDENERLLQAAEKSDDVTLVVPITTGENDFKELPFIIEILKKHNLLSKAKFVLTKTRANTKIIEIRKKTLKANNLTVMNYTMPLWEDFNQQKQTAKTKNSISKFVMELRNG